MIGNLLLAIGLTFTIGCGLTHDEPQMLNDVPFSTEKTSPVTGDIVREYYSLTRSFTNGAFPSADVTYIYAYDLEDYSYTSYTANIYLNSYYAYVSYMDVIQRNHNYDNKFLIFAEKSNGICYVRFSFPLYILSYVANLEFSLQGTFNPANESFGIDFQGYNLGSLTLVSDGQSIWNWFSMNLEQPFGISGSTNYDYDTSSFLVSSDYLFSFNLAHDYTTQYDLKLSFVSHYDGFVYGATQYGRGYSDGYNQGLEVGYTNGYTEGLSVAESPNATFLGLFNSLADTPIRYIRSLFAFEIFGMSALTIIMSLLSGIIVLHIMKKVF